MDNSKKIIALVNNFSETAKRHQMSSQADWRIANKEAEKLNKIFYELKSYGKPGREGLLKLISSEEPSVSLMAAVYSLKYNTAKSLKALKNLAKRPDFIGFQAKQAIKRWDEGAWQVE